MTRMGYIAQKKVAFHLTLRNSWLNLRFLMDKIQALYGNSECPE